MSLIKFAYNDIPHRAQSTSVTSEDSAHPHTNLFYGGSTIFWQSDGDSSDVTFQFNLPAGQTTRINYFYMRNILPLLATADWFRVRVRGSTDNFDMVDSFVYEVNNITEPNAGSHLEDFLYRGNLSNPYSSWRVRLNSSENIVQRFSKLYFGELFSFEKSPRYPYSRNYLQSAQGFESDSGALFATSDGRAQRNYELLWTHMANTERDNFENKIGKLLRDYPIVLIEESMTDHEVIDNRSTFGFARYVVESPIWKDVHNITLEFTEDILG
jgi:hypothetical protein